MKHDNEERPHSGRYYFGKTPMETFLDSLNWAKEKLLNLANPAAWLMHPDPIEYWNKNPQLTGQIVASTNYFSWILCSSS
jgi:hypothetical protein